MEIKKQYDISFESFITKEVLNACTDVEQKKLESVYTVVTALLKKHESGNTLNFDGIWAIDRDHLLNLIQHDQLEDFYVMLSEQVDTNELASVLVANDRIEFGDIYILHPNDIKLIADIQAALQDMVDNHNVFRDIQPPFDVDSND